MTPAPSAATVFTVEIREKHIGPVRGWLRGIWSTLVLSTPLFWFLDTASDEPIQECSVEVILIADRSVVVSFSYRYASEASRHAESLNARLQTMTPADFLSSFSRSRAPSSEVVRRSHG